MLAFQVALVVKNLPANAGDVQFQSLGSIPGLGRSSAGGNGNPLQYSCLETPLDREAWRGTVHGVTKSRIRLSDWAHSTALSPSEPVMSWNGYWAPKAGWCLCPQDREVALWTSPAGAQVWPPSGKPWGLGGGGGVPESPSRLLWTELAEILSFFSGLWHYG